MVVGVLVVHQSALLPLMLLAKVGDDGSDFAGGAAALSLILIFLCTLVLGVGDVIGTRSLGGRRNVGCKLTEF